MAVCFVHSDELKWQRSDISSFLTIGKGVFLAKSNENNIIINAYFLGKVQKCHKQPTLPISNAGFSTQLSTGLVDENGIAYEPTKNADIFPLWMVWEGQRRQ